MGRLLHAAGEEFKKSGYAGATTAAIARQADITEAQLFRYFGSKADLFREAVFKQLDRHFYEFNARHLVDASDAGSVREKARLYIAELQQLIAAHSEMLLSLVVAQTYAPQAMEGVGEIDSLRTYFQRGAALLSRPNAATPPKVDPRLMVRVSFAAVLACVMFKGWMFPPGLAGDEEIGDAIIDFVIDGISGNLDPDEHGHAMREEEQE